MSEEKYRELLENFGRVGELTEQSEILYSLYARIAAGLENHEPGSEELQISMGEAWVEVGKCFDGVVQRNPREAFDFALQLTMLPKSDDLKSEDIRKWMRGDGPVFLAREELRTLLLEYLKGDKGSDLVTKLKGYLSYDFSKIKDKHAAFKDPNCYLSLATMFLGISLQEAKETKSAETLFLTAKDALNDSHTKEVIDYYLEFEDTRWLAKELIKEDLLAKYPKLEEEIDSLLEWWRPEIKKFEIPASDTRVDAEIQLAIHEDVYNRLCWLKKPAFKKTDEEMRNHNRELLELLKSEFGWTEVDERLYPDPDSIS